MSYWILPFLITIGYASFVVYVGFRAKGKLDMKKSENWGGAGKSMNGMVMYFTMGAAAVSAYTFMGAPGWSFSKGIPIMYVMIYCIYQAYNNYFLGTRAWRLSQDHGISTMAEAFGERYQSKSVRGVASFVTSIALIFYAVLQISGCGYILNIMSGGNIPVWLGELVICAAIAFYVYFSGLRAVGWTNVAQGVLMLTIGWVVAFIISYKVTGSIWFTEIFRALSVSNPAHMTLPGNTGEWSMTFWTTSILISTFSWWPTMWIASVGSTSPNALRKSSIMLPTFFLSMIPMLVVGFICITQMNGYEGRIDSVALDLSLNTVPWIVAGLLGAGTLAAAQSSAAPLFQGVSMTWTADILAQIFKWDKDKIGVVQRNLMLPIIFLLVLPMSVLNPTSLPNLLLIGYGFLSQAYPLIIGMFFWPRSTKHGAFAGMFLGVAVLVYCSFINVHPLGIHAGVWGWMVNIPTHIIVSLLTQPERKEVIEKFYPKHLIEKLYRAA